MTRPLPLISLVAATALAGCSSFGAKENASANQRIAPTTASTGSSASTQAMLGTGTVQSIVAVPAASAPGAAAGASAQQQWYRVGLRMENGQTQYIQTNAPSLTVGQQVSVTAQGLVTR